MSTQPDLVEPCVQLVYQRGGLVVWSLTLVKMDDEDICDVLERAIDALNEIVTEQRDLHHRLGLPEGLQ